jgi:hypothetical protein
LRHDTERIRQMLMDSITPTIEALLREPPETAYDEKEWDALTEQLIETLHAAVAGNAPILSEYATNHAGIYEEHP